MPLNPNASTFTFNPGASEFVPSFSAGERVSMLVQCARLRKQQLLQLTIFLLTNTKRHWCTSVRRVNPAAESSEWRQTEPGPEAQPRACCARRRVRICPRKIQLGGGGVDAGWYRGEGGRAGGCEKACCKWHVTGDGDAQQSIRG